MPAAALGAIGAALSAPAAPIYIIDPSDKSDFTNSLICHSKPARIAGMIENDGDGDQPTDEGSTAHNVIPLVPPLSRARATEMVRDVVKAGRWRMTMMSSEAERGNAWVNARQIEFALRDGQILDEKVEFDGGKYYRFQMLRVCAGGSVVIEVALEALATLPCLFVTKAKGDQIG